VVKTQPKSFQAAGIIVYRTNGNSVKENIADLKDHKLTLLKNFTRISWSFGVILLMKIAVLSGKGGTGKTLVAVNIAAVAEKAVYVDCDVEEPNGYLFFTPELFDRKEVSVLIPVIDRSICTLCRKCIDFCNFNALACIANSNDSV
jgi:ferredoxin